MPDRLLQYAKKKNPSVPLAEVLAANLRSLRDRRKFTQGDLAEDMQRLGFPWVRETVGQIETGRRRVALEEALALSVVLNDEHGELYDCDGPISLSPSWDVFGLTITLVAEEPSQLAEARRHRDRLRRTLRDQVSMTYIANERADATQRELEEVDDQIAKLEARSKP
jgi:hypothetical protein